ncbi:hypothetical protein ACFLQ9_00180 [Bacteroidota bacterium]
MRKFIKVKRLTKKFWIFSFIIVLSGTILVYNLIPFFQLPKPSGSNFIGTKYFTLYDSTRKDIFSNDTSKFREIYSQVWYPAKINAMDKPEKYIPEAKTYSKLFAKSQGFIWIPFILNHLDGSKTNSYLNVPILKSDRKFPIIIFSHGHKQFYKHNTIIIEELVSNGYIVLAITHPYDSPCTVNSNNELVIYNSPKINIKEDENITSDVDIATIFDRTEASDDIDELRELYKIFYEYFPEDRIQENNNWLADILYTISELENLNTNILNDCVDLNAVGVSGFSFGGGAGGLAAMSSEKIKAGISLDCWQPGHTSESYFRCPFMFIMSEDHKGANDFFLQYSQNLVIDVSIKGTKHTNFSDMAIISGKLGKLIGHTGNINNRYGLSIIKKSVVQFFNQHLKGDNSKSLFEILDQYPEIDYKTNRK